MFGLIKLVFWPLSFAFKLIRLPFTIMACITKLGCLLVIGGIVAGVIALFIWVIGPGS